MNTEFFGSPVLMYLLLALGFVLSAWLLLAPRWRSEPWRAQRAGGLLVGALGLLFPLAVLFLPMWTVTESRPDGMSTRTESMWQRGVEPEVVVMLALLVALVIGFGIAAVFDSSHPNRVTLYALWGNSGFLLVVSVMSGFTVGWILFPIALVALAATIQASRRHQHIQVEPTSPQSGTH